MNRSSVVSCMTEFLHISTIQLADWLNPKLESISKNWWQECVIDKLSELQRDNADEKKASKLTELDLASLLRVAEKNWYSFTELNKLSDSQKTAQRRRVRAMVDVRNNWAHIPVQLPEIKEIIKDAETIKFFLRQLSSDENNVRAVILFINDLKKAGEITNDTVIETNRRIDNGIKPSQKVICSINDQRILLPKGQFIFDLVDESTGKKCKITKKRVVGRGASCLVYSGTLNVTQLSNTAISHNVIIKEFYPIELEIKGVKRKENSQLSIPQTLADEFENALKAFIDGQRKHVLFADGNIDKVLSPVFFSGEANNTYYVISELRQGTVLSDKLREEFSIIDALELTKSICRDIYIVHKGYNGVPQLYLDIKPSNIFVDGTRALLFDFNSIQNYKSLRYCSRSEGWAAPEQEFNKDKTGYKDYRKIGFHTDIFSIAAVLFWLLTGTKLTKDILSDVQKKYDWQKSITLKDTSDALHDDDFLFELDGVMKDMLCYDADERAKIFGTVNAAKDAERYVNYILKAANNVTEKKRHKETQENIREATEAVNNSVSSAKSEILDQTSGLSEAVQDVSERVEEAILLIKGMTIKDTTPAVSIPLSSSQVNYVSANELSIHKGEVKAVYNDGSTYVGEWKYGNRQGYGRYTSSDKKKIYIGYWNCDLRCGQGRLIDEDEGEYNGNWEKDNMNGQGVYKYKDGRFYEGEWKDGVRSGEGYFRKPGEKTYRGHWSDDKPSGKGFLLLESKAEYTGDFINGKPEGNGILLLSSGLKYEGMFRKGRFHGNGIMTYAKDDPNECVIYDGEWENGFHKGHGIMKWKNGATYDGEWDDLRNGNGVHSFSNGNVYDGEWKNDKMHGKGKLTYGINDPYKRDYYEGEWQDGIRKGHGVLIWKNGEKYDGNHDDIRSGHGIAYYLNGDVYDGDWKNDKRHGYGKLTYGENDLNKLDFYEGEWKEGIRKGHGIMKWKNGATYDGEWDDIRNGYGVHSSSNGDVYDGEWKNDKMHGKGKLTYNPDDPHKRDYYDGNWREGILKGHGVLVWKSGEKYDGEWDGFRNGHGIDYYVNGDVYDGDWRDDKRHGYGKLTYAENDPYKRDYYDGEWQDGIRKGHGVLVWKDGTRYDGEWENDLLNGHGVISYADGMIYDGEWKNGKRHGRGKMTFAEDDKNKRDFYDGEWQDDILKGHGIMRWKDGTIYDGEWDKVMNGHGVAYYVNGSVYDGEWKNDKRHGRGKLTYAENDPDELDFYDGEWENGIRKGHGVLSWKGGGKYDGEWNNVRYGHGIHYYADGDIYDGEWKDDKRHGYGKMNHSDGNFYEGEWVNGKRQGKGTFVWKDGSKYIGDFYEGLSHGYGEHFFSNGSVYKGEWRNDKQHGYGRMEYKSGHIYEGEWEEGIRKGKGKMTYPGGFEYDGEWNDDQNGFGIMIYPNGDKYEGYWQNGEKNGKGKEIKGAYVRKGTFVNGKKEGLFSVYNKAYPANIYTEKYENDQRI